MSLLYIHNGFFQITPGNSCVFSAFLLTVGVFRRSIWIINLLTLYKVNFLLQRNARAHTHTHTHARARARTHTSTSARTHTHTHARTHAHTTINVVVDIPWRYTHTLIHRRTHKDTQTTYANPQTTEKRNCQTTNNVAWLLLLIAFIQRCSPLSPIYLLLAGEKGLRRVKLCERTCTCLTVSEECMCLSVSKDLHVSNHVRALHVSNRVSALYVSDRIRRLIRV